MKQCPFCAEDIQDNAIKCKFCGEWFRNIAQPCKKCKTWIKKSDEECPYCGYSAKGKLSEPLASLDANEKETIENALISNLWNISVTARLLGKDRKTIATKMKKYGLSNRG